jgi:aminoglycoside phosphotransferase (APT) family kinase protein
VWKVRAGRGFVIEKDYAEDPGRPNPMYPNLPDHEAAAMRHLAGTARAPELVSYRPASAGVGAQVVYRYVSGTEWRSGVGDVARMLHEVHSLPAPRSLRRLHRSAAEALAHADAMVADTPVASLRHVMLAARPSTARTTPPRRVSLVHTDCGPGNIVRTRSGLVLIDWQCPGVGDAVEDVACFLSPAMMHLYASPAHRPGARQEFLTSYADQATVERYLRDGAAWHYRIAAYCTWRIPHTSRRQPEVAQRYREALAAELAFLATWSSSEAR